MKAFLPQALHPTPSPFVTHFFPTIIVTIIFLDPFVNSSMLTYGTINSGQHQQHFTHGWAHLNCRSEVEPDTSLHSPAILKHFQSSFSVFDEIPTMTRIPGHRGGLNCSHERGFTEAVLFPGSHRFKKLHCESNLHLLIFGLKI